ncbi:RagB/SusD family nutrient uptake outer membrane protein [Parafilimonas sp.]|uniref:RagB/SusD family nutrient uptake outer membrane protein n=1 Tax=Parafilimonas sp. TaxID=1969739 RepID=UPI0039E5E24D
MKKIFSFLSILMLFCSMGCKKFFEEPDELMTEEEAFADMQVADKFLTNVYSDLYGSVYKSSELYISPFSATTDEAESGNLIAGAYDFNAGQQSAYDYPLGDYWLFEYAYIRAANIYLKNIDNVPGDAALIAERKAEATFLKAFFYMQLLKNYGSFIIVDEVLSVNDNLKLPRASAEECVNYIVGMADAAAGVLPVTPYNSETGRATKGAALALKAEALLFYASPLYNPDNDLARWDAAANAAYAIISNADLGYGLYASYQNLFLSNYNQEVIYAYNAGSTNAMNLYLEPNGYSGWAGLNPTQEIVDAYEMSNGLAPFNSDGSVNTASGYDPANPYDNREPRFYASILYNGAAWQGRSVETFVGGTDAIGIGQHTRTQTGYFIRKFLDESVIITKGNTRYATWILYRLGTVILDFAEARNEASGPVSEVYTAVNAIRSRAGLPDLPTGLSQDEMREKIRHERLIEMAFEDNRFWDVRRWKIGVQAFNITTHGMYITKSGNTLNYEVVPVRTRYRIEQQWDLFPIPQSEINKNPLLEQNPGW